MELHYYLTLFLPPQHKLISDIKIGDSLDCSDNALAEFTSWGIKVRWRIKSGPWILGRKHLQSYKELVNRTPVENCPQGKGAEESWEILKDTFHTVLEVSIPKYKKSGKEGKIPAWLSQDLLEKLKGRQEGNAQGVDRNRYPRKSIGTLLRCAKTGWGRPRSSCSERKRGIGFKLEVIRFALDIGEKIFAVRVVQY